MTWTYDPTGQLLSEARSGANAYRTTYVYDPSGNRLLEENLVDGVTTSVYDAANRLLTAESLSGITTYSYDQAGNRRSLEATSGDITTYTWNGQNQLIQVELPDDEVITYVWAPVNKNGEERIVTREDGVEVQQLLWDNNNVVRETDDVGTVDAYYTYQPQPYGDLVSDHRDTDSSFYWFDALGSTTGLTDEVGNTTDEFRYTAFGKDGTTSGTSETPYRWVGQLGYRQDDVTGLSNLRARDYDPQNGQFVSEDPLGMEAGDTNFYRYVFNSVPNIADPEGLQQGNLIYTQGAIVYSNNSRFFDVQVGVKQGLDVVRDFGGVSFSLNYWDLVLFAERYRTTPPPDFLTPVSQWQEAEWDTWFLLTGKRKEDKQGPAPKGPSGTPEKGAPAGFILDPSDCTDDKLATMTAEQKFVLAIIIAHQKGVFPDKLQQAFSELLRPENIAMFLTVASTLWALITAGSAAGAFAATGGPGLIVGAALLCLGGADIALSALQVKWTLDATNRCSEMTDAASIVAEALAGLGIDLVLELMGAAGAKALGKFNDIQKNKKPPSPNSDSGKGSDGCGEKCEPNANDLTTNTPKLTLSVQDDCVVPNSASGPLPRNEAALAEAALQRDMLGESLGRVHSAYSGGEYGGKVATGHSQPGIENGMCAEDVVAAQLGPNANFHRTYGWRRNLSTGQSEWVEIPVCTRCQSKYSLEQFPGGTSFEPNGPWSAR